MELWRAIRDMEAAGWVVAVPHVCISRPGEVLYWTTASELEVRAEVMGRRPVPERMAGAIILAGALAILELVLTVMGRARGVGELNPLFARFEAGSLWTLILRGGLALYPFSFIWWLGYRRGSQAALWLAGLAAGVAAAGCTQWLMALLEAR